MKAPKGGEKKTAVWAHHKRIFFQEYSLSDGKMSDFLLMENDLGDFAIAVPFTHDRKVIAVRQFRYGADKFVIELPGGMPKRGQKLEDAVREELLEETGYVPERIVRLGGDIWPDPAFERVQFRVYLATECRKERPVSSDTFEVLEVVEFAWSEWLEMIRGGKIVDAKTIAATFLVELYMRREEVRE